MGGSVLQDEHMMYVACFENPVRLKRLLIDRRYSVAVFEVDVPLLGFVVDLTDSSSLMLALGSLSASLLSVETMVDLANLVPLRHLLLCLCKCFATL